MTRRPLALIVLDGWGLRDETTGNAVALAHTPRFDALWRDHPHTTLLAHGEHVGLPAGQMGNSEVGHLNLGAGRVVKQDIVRISEALSGSSLDRHPVLQRALAETPAQARIHLIGLFSDGGVHSHLDHLKDLWSLLITAGRWDVVVHAFLDGRDVPPASARRYLERWAAGPAGGLEAVASLTGRYYAMDRDRRWARTRLAYEALTQGKGHAAPDPLTGLEGAYGRGESDEFVKPVVIMRDGRPRARIEPQDLVIFFNFRADRARQLTRALSDPSFGEFPRGVQLAPSRLLTMVAYDETLSNPVLFPRQKVRYPLGEVVSEAGLSQLRIAETEKYAHVTYFFNGGEERVFPGESRVLVPSPDVATYDLQPEMSAHEVTARLVEEIQRRRTDLIVLNFANPDMVGHTGKLEAAVKACEVVDACLGRVIDALTAVGGRALVCADHGNAEMMIDPETGGAHTAHTTHPVPLILVDEGLRDARLRPGLLADVAPTMLDLMELPQRPEMDRASLLDRP